MEEYKILSARYANDDQTAVELVVEGLGSIMASEKDRPTIWEKFKEWLGSGGAVE